MVFATFIAVAGLSEVNEICDHRRIANLTGVDTRQEGVDDLLITPAARLQLGQVGWLTGQAVQKPPCICRQLGPPVLRQGSERESIFLLQPGQG